MYIDGADNVDVANKPTEKRPGCMQLDDMHVALVSLAVHLLHGGGGNFVQVKQEHGLVDETVLGRHRNHEKDGTGPGSGNFTPNFVQS